jgi:hypothetical protein
MPSASETIQSAREQELRKRVELEQAKDQLLRELKQAKRDGMTYQQLGDLLGVKRQRVHQLLS